MGSKGGPKVEARSRTGSNYNRAGHRWSAQWSDVPAELLDDAAKMKTLVEDPYLEIKVDGEFVSGPRAKKKDADDAAAAPAGSDEVLKRAFDELEARHAETAELLDKARFDLEEAAKKALVDAKAIADATKQAAADGAAIADLTNQLETLKATAAAASAASSTPPPADTTPDAPSGKKKSG